MKNVIFALVLLTFGCNENTDSDDTGFGFEYNKTFTSEPYDCDYISIWDLSTWTCEAGEESVDCNHDPLYAEVKRHLNDVWEPTNMHFISDDVVYMYCDPGDEIRLTYQVYF